jgi:hypothetical protein
MNVPTQNQKIAEKKNILEAVPSLRFSIILPKEYKKNEITYFLELLLPVPLRSKYVRYTEAPANIIPIIAANVASITSPLESN